MFSHHMSPLKSTVFQAGTVWGSDTRAAPLPASQDTFSRARRASSHPVTPAVASGDHVGEARLGAGHAEGRKASPWLRGTETRHEGQGHRSRRDSLGSVIQVMSRTLGLTGVSENPCNRIQIFLLSQHLNAFSIRENSPNRQRPSPVFYGQGTMNS